MSESLNYYHERSQTRFAKQFGRVVTAMVTPFRTDGRVDYVGSSHLARHLLERGSDSIAIAGTTGESATLSHDEQQELFWNIRGAVDGQIIAGTGSNSTKEAVELSRYVTRHNLADALLVVSPYYNRPSQYGIEHHYRAIAEETNLPVIMYDIPARTGRAIAPETIVKLAQTVDTIIGLKDAGGDSRATHHLMRSHELPEDFIVYSGDDSKNLALAKAGAVGAISVMSHWRGEQLQAMYRSLDNSDIPSATYINTTLSEDIRYESSDDTPNPHPTKTLLTEAGVIGSDYTRPPMSISPLAQENLTLQARAIIASWSDRTDSVV